MPHHFFLVLLLERLQLPLPVTVATCEGCQVSLTSVGSTEQLAHSVDA